MTLLFYVHWFWITLILYVSPSRSLPSTVYSVSTETPKLNVTSMSNESANRSAKAIGNLEAVPPSAIIPANATVNTIVPNVTQVKYKSTPKKHTPLTNTTRKFASNSTTSSPVVKETTVIDVNTTETISNLTENQTLNNATFSGAAHLENVTFAEGDGANQSLLLNSEQVGREEQVSSDNLSAAGITGITLGCVSIVAIIIAVSFFIYRNRGFNRPQVLNDRCSNLDSSGYIDDTSVRDNSEEMYSLDNDSFLNSLEAMTIQNYWTDTVKHTKL